MNSRKDERHGMSQTLIYRTWKGMIRRCHNPKAKDFKYYGAKGIFVCDEWRKSFLAFYNFIGPKPSPKHSVDRIDSTKGYEPSNVQWADPSFQQFNKPKKKGLCRYKGVAAVCRSKNFQARIDDHGKQLYLGTFATQEDAARAYDKAALKIHGSKATLNFPEVKHE